MSSDSGASGLADEVCERITAIVPDRGARIVASMRTAVRFAEEARSDDSGMRWAESVAYNLREALDSVVSGQDPAEGGIDAIATEWTRYGLVREAAEDEPAARLALFEVLDRVLRDDARASRRDRQLLTYLRDRSGADPLDGLLGPVAEYSALRTAVNTALHGTCDTVRAAELLDRTLIWFTRMFTPPDAQAASLIGPARSAYEGPRQLEELKRLVSSPHQLRLFLTRVEDASWLGPLHEAEMIPPGRFTLRTRHETCIWRAT